MPDYDEYLERGPDGEMRLIESTMSGCEYRMRRTGPCTCGRCVCSKIDYIDMAGKEIGYKIRVEEEKKDV